MAAQVSTKQGKTGLGLPARFKSFVHGMKSKKKDVHRVERGTRSKEVEVKQPFPSQDLISLELIPACDAVSVSDTRSLFRDSPNVRSLSIRVTVRFDEPLNYTHSQDYEGSSSLQPTEELCEALIRRVDHCSKELITRRDSSALDRTDVDGLAKPLRYEIQLQVLRHEIGTGTEAWASRTVRSYQRQPLSTEAAREVILATHYMIGLFLRHHDEAFVWKDGPVREDPVQEQKTFPYRPGRVQPLTSIPRSYFIEKRQEFESIPGYTIHLSFTSQNHHRTPSQWHETVEVNSTQSSPLTLANAENLFLDACYAVDGIFRSQRRESDALQDSCATHSGCRHCRIQDGDGVEMLVSVKNNVGPLFDNLERTTSTNMSIFWKDHGADCLEFVEKAKAAIVQVCHETDESISRMNDFEFYIIELRGRGWTIDEPLAFTLGPDSCLERRTVDSLLDRLQTGVADMLRGNAIAVRMTARKRGHFILHKTLVAREPMEKQGNNKKSTEKSKAYVLDKLKQRIERDIEMVCKDTCTVVNRETEAAKTDKVAGAPPPESGSMKTGLLSSRRLSDITTPSKLPASDDGDSARDKPGSRGSELHETPEPVSPSSVPQHAWPKVARDPITGQRVFPLVPSRHSSLEQVAPVPHESTTHHTETTTSVDLSASCEPSNAVTSQTTSDSSVSSTEQEFAESSTKEFLDQGREMHTTEGSSVSTRPRTPDLVSGGSPSIRSSILMTPNVNEPVQGNEIDFVQNPALEAEDAKFGENGKVDSRLTKLYLDQSTSSSTSRPASRDGSATSTSSQTPLAQTEHHSQQDRRDATTAEIDTLHPDAEFKSDRSPIESPKNRDNPTAIGDYFALSAEANAKIGDFSQSKPDFDFSSPLAATPPEDDEATKNMSSSAEAGEAIIHANNQQEFGDKANPDPLEGDDDDGLAVDPERPEPKVLRHRPSKSFGSAGYLGSFQEQRFYGVGLRRALVASPTTPRPVSRQGVRDGEEEQDRPESALSL